jgi:hypothetical protein
MPGQCAGLFVSRGMIAWEAARPSLALSPIKHTICFENAGFDPTLLQNRH